MWLEDAENCRCHLTRGKEATANWTLIATPQKTRNNFLGQSTMKTPPPEPFLLLICNLMRGLSVLVHLCCYVLGVLMALPTLQDLIKTTRNKTNQIYLITHSFLNANFQNPVCITVVQKRSFLRLDLNGSAFFG